MLFFATDENDVQLWTSDGSESGTQLLKVINPTGDASLYGFTELNGKLYFYADEDAHGYQLLESDGTSSGTQRVALINTNGPGFIRSIMLTKYNNKLYFMGNDGINGTQLWASDGTESGTQLLKIINTQGDTDALGFKVFNGELYFFASDGTNGYELWVTNGTTGGTNMVKDINTTGSSYPEFLTEYNGKLYFRADDGTNGVELWVSNGTPEGTQMIKDINVTGNSYPSQFTEYDGKLYFSATDGTNGYELWVTDGTTAGTHLVKDINPGASYSWAGYYSGFVSLNGKLYFEADHVDYGWELWETDGTSEGTKIVIDLNPGTDGAEIILPTLYNGEIYFIANDNTNGLELWSTNGTAAGTHKRIPDIAPNSDPLGEYSRFLVFNDALYFGANYTGVGQELYVLKDASVSINEQANLVKFDVFPNPSYDKVTITTEKNTSFTLLDLTGKVLLTFEVNQQKEISIAELSTGVYILKDETSGSHKKIVKQ